MYMSQHRFTPVPEKFDLWVPYNRNYMSTTGRAPGAALSRILRLIDQPEQFFAVGIWTGHDTATAWSGSEESRMAAQPNIDLGLYDGYPMEWSRWTLSDFAWGLGGAGAIGDAGAFVRHVTWALDPDIADAQETLARAALSLLARRPRFLCGETYRSHKGDRLLLVHTYRSAEDWPLGGGEWPDELALLRHSDLARTVAAKAPALQAIDCSVYEWVWGPEKALLQAA